MVSKSLTVVLSVTILHLVSGMSFMTPEPNTTPTSTPDPYHLGDLIHAALRSKEYLGESSAGTTTNPTQAVPGLGQAESTATVISPGLLTTALSSSAASQTGTRNPLSPLSIEEETTTTLITTTTITTMHVPGLSFTSNFSPVTLLHNCRLRLKNYGLFNKDSVFWRLRV